MMRTRVGEMLRRLQTLGGTAGAEALRALRQFVAPRRCLMCEVLLTESWPIGVVATDREGRADGVGENAADEPTGIGDAVRCGRLCPECMSQIFSFETELVYCGRCGFPMNGPKHAVAWSWCRGCRRMTQLLRHAAEMSGGRPARDSGREKRIELAGQVAFDSVTVLCVYDGLIRDAILRSKRASGDEIMRLLAATFLTVRGERIRALGVGRICPVPSDRRARRERRTCNAERLAESLAAGLGLPMAVELERPEPGVPQKSLPLSEERFLNVRNAFRLVGDRRQRPGRRRRRNVSADSAIIAEPALRRVLLVDDVLTSGATCHEAASILLETGVADEVHVAVIARGDAREWV